MSDAFPNLASRLRPREGLGLVVPGLEVATDCALKLPNAVEAPAADHSIRNQRKPALHQVEPRRAGRREVRMEAGMRGKPLANLRVFVGPVVVADQMNLPPRVLLRQQVEEGNEPMLLGGGRYC